MGKKMKEFLLIHIGLLLVAGKIHFILAPNKLALGGVSGLSILINYFFPNISVGALMTGLNILLFIVGFIFLGFQFGAKTIYASFALSFMVMAMGKWFPVTQPLSDDMLVQLIFGITVSAIGAALIFRQNASTGGTDIIAMIINKYYYLDIGKAVLVADIMIALTSAVLFGVENGMYSLFGVFLNGMMIDYVIQQFSMNKEVVIISTHCDDIKKFIITELGRGATVHLAKGAYSDSTKEVITTVLGKREFIKLKNYISELDQNAFITIHNNSEIVGGFRRVS